MVPVKRIQGPKGKKQHFFHPSFKYGLYKYAYFYSNEQPKTNPMAHVNVDKVM